MLHGRCLCGAVICRDQSESREVVACHCQQCRLAQGTPFATHAAIDRQRFELVQGESWLKFFAASPNKCRWCCGQCGSPLCSEDARLPGVIRLRVDTLTTPLALRGRAGAQVCGAKSRVVAHPRPRPAVCRQSVLSRRHRLWTGSPHASAKTPGQGRSRAIDRQPHHKERQRTA